MINEVIGGFVYLPEEDSLINEDIGGFVHVQRKIV